MEVDFQTLFQCAPGRYMVLEPADRYLILAVSDAYLEATMTVREGMVGRPLFEVFPDNPEDPHADGVRNLRDSLDQVRRTGLKHQMAVQKYDIRDRHGIWEERFWSPANYPVFRDGRLECIIHAAEDVTELHRAYERLQHADRLKTQFFANVSHELRTPLTLILGPVERLLARGELAAELDVVRRNAQMLLKLVNDLLDLSKLDAGMLRADLTAGDLAALVRLTCSQFETVAEQRGVRLVVETPERLVAEFDADKLTRMLGNLISNALKFTPAGGRIRCTLSADDGQLLLEVADSGPGIPPEQREAVFERFRQVDGEATRRVGGTGLGLPIVREFAQLHGGEVSVQDAPEGGTLALVSLPYRMSSEQPAGESHEPALVGAVAELAQPETGEDAPHRVGRARVLVVEDNVEMRAYLRQLLAESYNVVTAADGLEGLRQARSWQPDVIVTDLMMPGMTGAELIDELRRDDQLQEVPVMLLTARADDDLKVRLLRDGAQDYLPKPFWPEELKVRVANLVTIRLAREMIERELQSRSHELTEVARDLQRHLAESYSPP